MLFSSRRVFPVRPTILALDLEGTLISNAISQIPRPGLKTFLEDMRAREPLALRCGVYQDLLAWANVLYPS